MRLFCLWLLCTTCAAAAPNVLLIVSDDQRPDSISGAGRRAVDLPRWNAALETPQLDRLAARGTTFSRAYAGYPICHVSRAQIITGCHAFKALPKYPAGAINPQLATLGGTFQKAGYHTWYSGKWHNDGHPKQRGYTATSGLYSAGGGGKAAAAQPAIDGRGRPLTGYRGWTFKDEMNKPELAKGIGLQADNSRHIADGAIHALQATPRDKPFLLHVNFAFPHDPRQWPAGMKGRYDAARLPLPPSFAPAHPFDHGNLHGRDEELLPTPRTEAAVREELALYYAMIADVDAQVGRIFEALAAAGHAEDTLIIFTSDQGLALGSHGLLGKQNQYEHTIRSPFIIAGPGVPQGESSAALICLSDIFPTLCDLAGIPIPPTVEARSLAPLLRHKAEKIHDFVTGVFTDTQRMICDGSWKYIAYPKVHRVQLFDLETDPHELNDLSAEAAHQARREELAARLHGWRQQHGDPSL